MLRIVKFAAVGVVVYFAIALGLLAWPLPAPPPAAGQATAQLDTFVRKLPLPQVAPASTFQARDGAKRLYRLYAGAGSDVLVFLHGSGSDSRYLAGLAQALSGQSGLTVATLDMRGHGAEPGRRGDVDTVGQQEQDIADLLGHLKSQKPFTRFLLAGHSIGGGLAIRYAAGQEQPRPDALVLLAPYIHRSSPVTRPNSGGWATPFVARIAGLEMLQRVGIHAFDGLPVLRFEMPPAARDGTETLLYTSRMFRSITPRADWRGDLARIACPVLVLAAEHDSIFRSEGYAEVFATLRQATVEILPGIDHFQLAVSEQVPNRIAVWMGRAP